MNVLVILLLILMATWPRRDQLLSLLLLVLAACGPAVLPIPPPAPIPPGEATCHDACDRWAELGCEEAEHTPEGLPCSRVCEINEDMWDLDCFAAVDTCEAIESC